MKYRYAVHRVTALEVETLLGVPVLQLTEGDIVTSEATIQGIEIEFAEPLIPGQISQLKHYLTVSNREEFTEVA